MSADSAKAKHAGTRISTAAGSEVAIRVRELTKVFNVYRHPADLVLEVITRRPRHQRYTALEGLSLDVPRGQVLGILGRNGAGKSTLLKLLAGTLTPTSGTIEIAGRVTAILELGTGFHPDYTGRENILMGGLCLGMTRREIEAKIDQIIAFSELEDFIDAEFRTYSSGMQARLTFSTATAVDPDVLIVDEALAVGDARFQLKCFEHMTRLRDAGKTILLVTHDENAVTRFCDRALIVEHGRILVDDHPKTAVAAYLELMFGGTAQRQDDQMRNPCVDPGHSARRFGNQEARLLEYGLEDESGARVKIAQSGKKYSLFLRARAKAKVEGWSAGFTIKDARGLVMWGITTTLQGMTPQTLEPDDLIEARVDLTMWLASGDYFVNLGLGYEVRDEMIDFIDDALHFKVVGPHGIFDASLVNLDPDLRIEVLQQADTS
ncbi:MAG: ABC transporter ATP-binding protein [Sphingobacteriia bacterium]|nr:ABC transporter ATP-binding protein [Sphingobacteriia bacterium]NCC39740.1 ABC transporter ATP-binding protein [Gammaproteobacteria bacterium]